MKKIVCLAAVAAVIFGLGTLEVSAQKKLKIGKTEIVLQSPFKVQDIKSSDTSEVVVTVETVKSKNGESVQTTKKRYYRGYSRNITDVYFGMGIFTKGSFGGEKYYPSVQYGKAIDLQTGLKFFYRPARWYAIGTQIQYSFYSYRIDGAAAAGFIGEEVPGVISAEYFRSDNIGTAWLNRFYLYRDFFIELGVYGDYSFSKRYMVKTSEGKKKYRDCSRFTPLQAGVQASVNIDWFSIYTKYRLTDMFSHDILPLDPPRLSVGAMISF